MSNKKFKYLFEHTVFHHIDGIIKDQFKNHYEIVATDSSLAHTQVPYNSILKIIKSMDGKILHDLRRPLFSNERLLRKKIKEEGRGSLSDDEYKDAIKFEVIR